MARWSARGLGSLPAALGWIRAELGALRSGSVDCHLRPDLHAMPMAGQAAGSSRSMRDLWLRPSRNRAHRLSGVWRTAECRCLNEAPRRQTTLLRPRRSSHVDHPCAPRRGLPVGRLTCRPRHPSTAGFRLRLLVSTIPSSYFFGAPALIFARISSSNVSTPPSWRTTIAVSGLTITTMNRLAARALRRSGRRVMRSK